MLMGPDEQAKLRALKENAEKMPINLATIMEAINKGPEAAFGNDPKLHCEIPIGYRVAFTIEQHPGGWFRHASFSVHGKRGAVPNPWAVKWLVEQLGFKRSEKFDATWIELPDAPHPAVNVLELIPDYVP